MEVDLGAEQLLAAERQEQKIAVEVKSFLEHSSAIGEFHRALGQFINYRIALTFQEPVRVLYMAVPDLAYNSFFQLDFPQTVIEDNHIKLLVYEINEQEIIKWIN
ncbi:MAG: element excision factor XisH family protein [Cyanobacteria bacterium P01_F01_bin.116]